jgi:serine/threonine protein phosphatase PrpC
VRSFNAYIYVFLHAKTGPRDSMEDAHTVRDDIKFYGVYDGHGGEEAANILRQVS